MVERSLWENCQLKLTAIANKNVKGTYIVLIRLYHAWWICQGNVKANLIFCCLLNWNDGLLMLVYNFIPLLKSFVSRH